MKKFIILIAILAIIVFNSLDVKSNFSLRDYFSFGKLSVYTKTFNNGNLLPNISKNSQNGKLVGESLECDNIEVGNILESLNGNIIFVENVENLTILYCYTYKIPKKVKVKNHYINLQIATCENYTIIGWPLILGSF